MGEGSPKSSKKSIVLTFWSRSTNRFFRNHQKVDFEKIFVAFHEQNFSNHQKSRFCENFRISLSPGRSLEISGSSVTILVTFFIQHFRGRGERPLYFSAQVYAYSFAPKKYRSDSVSSSSRTSCTNFCPRTKV